MHEPEAMAIDAAAVIDGYLRVLRGNGGRLATGAEAVTLARDDNWTVATPAGEWRARHVVNAAGGWADVVAARAGVAPLGLVAMRRTAAIVPAPDEVAAWPLVMDVAGRYYCEPETGGLLISPADETPLDPCDVQPEELDVALALERVRDATGLPLRSVRRGVGGTAHVRARPGAGARRGSGRARLLVARRPGRGGHQDRAGNGAAAGAGDGRPAVPRTKRSSSA